MVQAVNISEMGRRAFWAGIKTSDCPFALRSSARSWWMKGYKEARQSANEDYRPAWRKRGAKKFYVPKGV